MTEPRRLPRESRGYSRDTDTGSLSPAIGHHTAWILVQEIFGWRVYANHRQLSASVGSCPTPYNSGKTNREQGISKAGNAKIRALLIRLAWRWLRKQPESEPSKWFKECLR